MIQTSKNKTWFDEAGVGVPYSRITSIERLKERRAASMLRQAKRVNKQLCDLKETIEKYSDEVFDAVMEENDIKVNRKGNFTFYNFDRSIKVETSVHSMIEFDDLTIQAAQTKFMEFVDKSVETKNQFVKELIFDAFQNTKGKLDVKKILTLIKYRSKIDNKLFHEATDLIEKAIRRPNKKTYFKIWERQKNGQYKAIELNFSAL